MLRPITMTSRRAHYEDDALGRPGASARAHYRDRFCDGHYTAHNYVESTPPTQRLELVRRSPMSTSASGPFSSSSACRFHGLGFVDGG